LALKNLEIGALKRCLGKRDVTSRIGLFTNLGKSGEDRWLKFEEIGMRRKIKKGVALFLMSSLVFFHFAGIAPAKEYLEDLGEKGGYMAADLAVLRPIGIAATAVGAVIYVISLPFSLAGGNEEEARQKLVIDPATYTFTRPLGEP
jgi:hypothetical protein